MSTKEGDATLPKWAPTDGLRSWLEGKSGEELDVIEFGPRPAYLDTIDRRNPRTGERESVKVRVVAPRHIDKAKARVDALDWVRKITRTKERPTWEDACKIFGEIYVDELDTVCLVARLTRDHDKPEHQHRGYEQLDDMYGRASIVALFERICLLDDWTDPRVDTLSSEDFWAVVETIDRVKNTSPLVAIAGGARDKFVSSMASELMSFRMGKPSSHSGETLTPEP